MPGSFSKSEGYRDILHDAAVPSTPLCFYIIFSTLLCYHDITGRYGVYFTSVFFLIFIISSAFTVYGYRSLLNSKKALFVTAAILLILLLSLSYYIKSNINSLISDRGLPESIENTEAVITDISYKRYTTGICFRAEYNNRYLNGIIYYQDDNTFNNGDIIFLHKKIDRINVSDKNPYNSYLISRGIHYTSGMNERDVTVIKKNEDTLRASLQKKLLKRIDLLFKEPSAGLIKALLTGNQNYIEKRIIIQYRDSGVLHCLSASGLHVAIFASIPMFLLLPFFRRNSAMSASFISVLFYLYITDMPVSLLRAVVMFGLFFAQSLLYRGKNVFNYLMLTCSAVLIFSPSEIFNPGTQLSFAATAGILIFYKQFRESLNNLPGIIADTTSVTLSAQILSLPIVLFRMNQFNTAGLLTNLIIIPLITLIMGLSMFTLILSVVSVPAAVFTGDLTGLVLKITLLITDFTSRMKLNFYVYNISPVLILLVLTGLLPLIRHRKIIRLGFFPVIISAVLSTLYLKTYHTEKTGYIVTDGVSKAEIKPENNRYLLKLDLKEGVNTDEILSAVKNRNPDINIIELADGGKSNLAASRRIMNDYLVSEFRFSRTPEITGMFKKTIIELEKENIIVKFQD